MGIFKNIYKEKNKLLKNSQKERSLIINFFEINENLFGEIENYLIKEKVKFYEFYKKNKGKAKKDALIKKYRIEVSQRISNTNNLFLMNYLDKLNKIETLLVNNSPLLNSIDKFFKSRKKDYLYSVFPFYYNAFSTIRFYSLLSIKSSIKEIFKQSPYNPIRYFDLSFNVSLFHDFDEILSNYIGNRIGIKQINLNNLSILYNPLISIFEKEQNSIKEFRFYSIPYSSLELGKNWLADSLNMFNFALLSLDFLGDNNHIKELEEEIKKLEGNPRFFSFILLNRISYLLNNLEIYEKTKEKIKSDERSKLLIPPSILKIF